MWAIIRVPETRFLIYCSLLSSSRERLLVFMLVRMMAAARLQSPLNNLFGFGIVFPAFFFIMSTPPIIFAFSAIQTLAFRSFEGKVFILSLPNLVWVFIGLVACMGLLLVKIAL